MFLLGAFSSSDWKIPPHWKSSDGWERRARGSGVGGTCWIPAAAIATSGKLCSAGLSDGEVPWVTGVTGRSNGKACTAWGKNLQLSKVSETICFKSAHQTSPELVPFYFFVFSGSLLLSSNPAKKNKINEFFAGGLIPGKPSGCHMRQAQRQASRSANFDMCLSLSKQPLGSSSPSGLGMNRPPELPRLGQRESNC